MKIIIPIRLCTVLLILLVPLPGQSISAQQAYEQQSLVLKWGRINLSPHLGLFLGGGNLFEAGQENFIDKGAMYGVGGAILLQWGELGRGRIGIDFGYNGSVGTRRIYKKESIASGYDDMDLNGINLQQEIVYLVPVLGSVSRNGDWEYRGGIGPSWVRTSTNLWEDLPEVFASYDQKVKDISIIGMVGYRLISLRMEIHFSESVVRYRLTQGEMAESFWIDGALRSNREFS